MTTKTGIDAQFGIKKETTYGTPVTVDTFIDLVASSLTHEISRIESKAIRKGQRVQRSDDWAAGTKKVTGDIELELWNKDFGEILQLCFGAVNTAGTAAPYTHTFTPGDLPSATVQIGVPDVTDGTVRPFTYAGVMVDSWELSAAVGTDPVALKLSVVGRAETNGTALASASYSSGVEFMSFVGGSVSVSGSSVPVTAVTLQGANGLNSDRYFLGSQNMSQPLEASMREYTGTIEPEFNDLTLYNMYLNSDEVALVLTFAGVDNPTHKLVITANVRFDGKTPEVGGTEAITNPMDFKCIATGADSTAITAVYHTPDSTP